MPATGSDASAAAALAMAQYFDGERREMYAIVAGSLVCVGLALCLLLVARDGFAKGLMVMVVISAGLLSATAGSLLVRDAALRTELQLHFRSETAPQAVDGERKRLAVIIANYKYLPLRSLRAGLSGAPCLRGVATRLGAWCGRRRVGPGSGPSGHRPLLETPRAAVPGAADQGSV